MRILVSGATGLLGKELIAKLMIEGHEVRGLARRSTDLIFLPDLARFSWDAEIDPVPLNALRGVDAVIHLAGTPVADERWTDERKKSILDSRVKGTRAFVTAMESLPASERPKLFLSSSAIGIYGDQDPSQNTVLTEDSTLGQGFLAEVCSAWEQAAHAAKGLGVQVLILRTGIVLSRLGGALPKMPPVTLGNGKQWMSWIHVDDWVNSVQFLLKEASAKPQIEGPVNLVSPAPVQNREFVAQLVRAAHYPLKTVTPKAALAIALGEMSTVVTASQQVQPKRLLDWGFKFRYQDLESALKALFEGSSYLEQVFKVYQFVPKTREEIFPFFSAAENLERITPPWLNFKIINQSTPQVQKGSLIDYQIRLYGVPMRWKTLISQWVEQEVFVDEQLAGPYQKWHHTHEFKPVVGGTLLEDTVVYRVPGGVVGKLALSGWIGRDVKSIFNYRTQVIDEIFKLTDLNAKSSREKSV